MFAENQTAIYMGGSIDFAFIYWTDLGPDFATIVSFTRSCFFKGRNMIVTDIIKCVNSFDKVNSFNRVMDHD